MSTDPMSVGHGFTEGELKAASYWVRNRLKIERSIHVFLILFILLTWGYSIWTVVDAYAISYPRESRITQEITNNQVMIDVLERERPQGLQAADATVLKTTDNRYDMFVDIENVNDQWWADFTYTFNLSGEVTPSRTGFVMPGEKTTIAEVGFAPKMKGGAVAQFTVESIRWHRVDPKVVGQRYVDFANDRLNIAFDNVKYDPSLQIGTKTIGRTSFDLVDRGSFGFWSMDLVIKLYRGNDVVGVTKFNVRQIQPNETRRIEIDWFDQLGAVSRTEIIPIVNLLDARSYLPTQQFRNPTPPVFVAPPPPTSTSAEDGSYLLP